MAAKKESTFINMVLTLFLVTAVASTALGFVYEATKDQIEEVKKRQKEDAIKIVVPAYDNSPFTEAIEIIKDEEVMKIYPAKKGEEVVGMAIETFTKDGFTGLIKLMVGFKPDGSIFDISVLEHKETPGLGDKMEKSKSDFSEQFKDKHPEKHSLKVVKDGGVVDAITASTISSRAYCDAVQRAYEVFNQNNKKE